VRGKFITFEGGEGAGKTTQIRLLAHRIRNETGVEIVTTREPGGTPFAERLRAFILSPSDAPPSARAEALLFYAARSDHLEHLIRPALERGAWVLCDRFMDSTRAYQGAAGSVPEAEITALEEIVIGSTRPDLTLVLDLEPTVGLARTRRRSQQAGDDPEGPDAFESRDIQFHAALRRAFERIAAAEPVRCLVLDASAPPEVISERVWQAVRERLKPGSA